MIIMLTTLSGFSQTDTKTDSIVPLKVPIAKLVIKDILSGDGAKVELKEAYKMLDEKNLQIGLYKQKDSLKDEKIANLNVIIDKKDQQFSLEREKSNSLLKELKAQKFKTFIYKAGSGIGLIMTVLFLVK
jgi:hypothetical protein